MALNPILLDTNAYAAFKRGDGEAVAILQQAPMIGLNAVVLGELLAGFAAGTRTAENRKELAEFLAMQQVRILPVDGVTAEHYATVYVALRGIGRPIPTNDLWVAATALQHRLALFSLDHHFRLVDQLQTGSTLADLQQ